jgi:hypothetical protein
VRAARHHPTLAVATLALLAAAGSGPEAAAAVDSPRLDQVTCQGLRVRQGGLPASAEVVIEVGNPTSGRELARQKAASNAAGVLDTRVAGPFDGASELVVEVEIERGDEEVELAEAVHEFDRPCPAGASTGQRARVVAAASSVVALVLVATGATVFLLRRREGR